MRLVHGRCTSVKPEKFVLFRSSWNIFESYTETGVLQAPYVLFCYIYIFFADDRRPLLNRFLVEIPINHFFTFGENIL